MAVTVHALDQQFYCGAIGTWQNCLLATDPLWPYLHALDRHKQPAPDTVFMKSAPKLMEGTANDDTLGNYVTVLL